MKKAPILFIFLIISLVLISCSKSESENNPSNKNHSNGSCINPPDWLIGTWIRYSGEVEVNKEIVSQNNIISYNYDISNDLREIYCGKEALGITTEEEFGSDYYLFRSIQTSFGTTIPLDRYFFRISADTMKYNDSPDESQSGIIYIKQ